MKKEYTAPQIRIRKVNAPALLQASVGVGGGSTGGNYAKPSFDSGYDGEETGY